MPRLLPRLLKILQDAPQLNPARNGYTRYKKRVSMKKPVPETPSFTSAGRTHSILLDDANPITEGHLYDRHKSLPPRVRLLKPLQDTGEHDHPREMTEEEREWWSSPYLRMLASPLRECQITRKKLPCGALSRSSGTRAPPSLSGRTRTAYVNPNGVEHPKFKPRRSTPACYITCWKDAIAYATTRIPLPKISPNLTVPPLLPLRIGYQLRLRVFQELELLTKRLIVSPLDDPAATVLRRLTRSEWNVVRQTNTIPHKHAVALMVVPPVNQNPETKEKPQPTVQLDIADIVENDTNHLENSSRPLLPLSVLHPVTDNPSSPLLPNAQAPLYHGLSLFPARPQRAALHKALCKLLEVERRARSRALLASGSSEHETSPRARGDAKGSHAFLLCSNQHTARRADVVPLAIALWRLRMWDGQAYAGETSHWEVNAEWRLDWAKRMY
ncbi:hypothetical protein DFH29DRAFT_792915 [Suillus ampliporus]|nr:hypothetical protein DFH29DRAFT_792915 [Suillus ampliporus]